MCVYSSPLRRSLKRYRKLLFNPILNTAVVNALHMFQNVTGRKISVTTFRRMEMISHDIQTRRLQLGTIQDVFTNVKGRKERRIKFGNTVLNVTAQTQKCSDAR